MPTERIHSLASLVGAELRRRFRRDAVLADPALRSLHESLNALDAAAIRARPALGCRYVVLDTETTGFHAYAGDEIVSVAALEMQGLELTGRELITLVDPGRPIPEESQEVHGIGDEDVAGSPTIEAILPELVAFIDDAAVVGHHIGFDLRFINRSLQKRVLARLAQPWLDTMLLYTAYAGRVGHYSLDEVTRACRVQVRHRHTARGDALATALTFRHLALHLADARTTVGQLARRQHDLGSL
jgi:DNA polymerase-3 subunit epsilon